MCMPRTYQEEIRLFTCRGVGGRWEGLALVGTLWTPQPGSCEAWKQSPVTLMRYPLGAAR